MSYIEGCPPAQIRLTNLQGYAQMDPFGRITLVHGQCSSHQPLNVKRGVSTVSTYSAELHYTNVK